ncbi:MAG: xanthine dehydrogenase family protein molybdopterin-binding subunit [Brucellaceae bacterium]|nr:xanthine dehydrogenase family protein molybdopterin-binding subunit [Brucellaceae bacterium]
MNVVTPKFGVGASVLRLEDNAFITGHGRYTDDIRAEGELRGYVLRSPVAAGAFTIKSVKDAQKAPGVHLVLTGKDLAGLKPVATWYRPEQPDGKPVETKDIPVLCTDAVHYVGDAVAFIVADTLKQAMDAAELVEIDYDASDAIAETRHALDADAPLVWDDRKDNTAYVQHMGDKKASDAAFAKAKHVSRIEFYNNRLVCNYMEPRGVLGEWNADEKRFVMTTGTQGVHGVKADVVDIMGLKDDELRVITPDVGGGFGPKGWIYRENVLVMEAVRRLRKPVKWICDRTEHFLTDAQGRDNLVEAEMAMDAKGRFLALRINLVANMGAYISKNAIFIPFLGATMATGVYDIPVMDMSITGVYTNTSPVDAYRGAGRPEAAYLIERLVDECARDMGLAREEIRRRNFIRPEQFPYKTAGGRTYDVGELDGHMTEALKKADWEGFDKRAKKAAKKHGKVRGIGLSTYIEACAFAGSEPAHVRLRDDGTVELLIGTQSNGQGHKTAYAQFVAEKLNLDIARIEVRQGDTDELASGGGTGGSRSIPLGGVSASRAGDDLAEKIRKIAADELEAAPDDIELVDGNAVIAGTDRTISFADIAAAATDPEMLKGFGNFEQHEATYPNGTHICEVEIDPETGDCEIVAYTIVDDFGATVNPILLAGQVHGGVVQGIGQCLTEDTVYDEDGQLLTASFMDYAMPRADTVPSFDFSTRNVPSTTNAMGIKGAGEAGTIGSCPAVMNAIVDAVWRARGIRQVEMPATPNRLWQLLNEA